MPPLQRLQSLMIERGIDAYLVPRADCFFGEEVRACDERLQYISGFDGSAGMAVIRATGRSILLVDGRYTLQAAMQLDPEVWEVVEGTLNKIKDRLEGLHVSYDPWLFTQAHLCGVEAVAEAENLVDLIWEDRPEDPGQRVFSLPDSLTGESSKQKFARITEACEGRILLITQPDAYSWITNTRGDSLRHSPVCLNFGLMYPGWHPASYSPGARHKLIEELQCPGDKIQYDPQSTPLALVAAMGERGHPAPCPIKAAKAQKNEAEIKAARAAQAADTRAFAKFFDWFKTGPEDELEIIHQLEAFRREDPSFGGPSFDTICGSGPNGAIIHYRVSEASNRKLEQGDFIVLDSGGQYPGATTDVTRTLAVGQVAEDMRRAYTLVLKGLIALSVQQFPVGTTGHQLDVLARAALWNAGLNYGHGTGHGVGAGLNVHESPPNVSPRALNMPLKPGMIFSNEPGYYEEGRFGLRLENLLLVEERAPGWLGFETLTYVPFDEALVMEEMLSKGEREWLTAYQQKSTVTSSLAR